MLNVMINFDTNCYHSAACNRARAEWREAITVQVSLICYSLSHLPKRKTSFFYI